jgi:superoxide dismutase
VAKPVPPTARVWGERSPRATDPVNGRLINQWISLHQDGVPARWKPILVMDVWEHAFMRDYKASERAKYVEAFFKNIDWTAVDQRLHEAGAMRAA